MTMNNEAYRENDIKNIPFPELFTEYQEKVNYVLELETEMNQAYSTGDIGEVFAISAVLGVVSTQLQIMKREVTRRDEEDGPLSAEEAREVEAVLFQQMINNLFS